MKPAIHILIWLIALLFIADQVIALYRGNKSRPGTGSEFTSTNGSGSNNKTNVPPPPPPDPDAIVLKATLDNSAVEIDKVTGNGAELIVTGTVTNQSVDGSLRFCADYYGEPSRMYDDVGNKIICNYIQVGNQANNSSVDVKLISGVKTPIKMKFAVPTIKGITQPSKIVLLELWATNFRNYVKSEFRNIKIEKVGIEPTPTPAVSPAATPTPNATPATASPNPTVTPTNIEK